MPVRIMHRGVSPAPAERIRAECDRVASIMTGNVAESRAPVEPTPEAEEPLYLDMTVRAFLDRLTDGDVSLDMILRVKTELDLGHSAYIQRLVEATGAPIVHLGRLDELG